MWPNPQETTDLVAFTEATFNGKLHFLFTEVFNKDINTKLRLVVLLLTIVTLFQINAKIHIANNKLQISIISLLQVSCP